MTVDRQARISHTDNMCAEARKDVRYTDIGRVDCAELCVLPGVLDDISLQGCKIHYDTSVSVNMDNDYEVHIRPSRSVLEPIVLLCHPQWVRDIGSTTEIGFKVLRSPDTAKLTSYIEKLHAENDDFTSSDSMLDSLR